MARKRIVINIALVLLIIGTLASPVASQKSAEAEGKATVVDLPTVIWRDPGPPSKLNLFYGAGGKEHAPDAKGQYTFLKEDMNGTSPKFDVTDDHGVHWRVKLGQEPQSETAATRLLWAAGYFVDEDYFLPEIKVEGLPQLQRGQEFVTADGTVHRARLERRGKEIKKLSDWNWFKNPFLGTRELNGLRVMMSLLNNWDLKPINNSVYEVDGERRYLVSDVGATFGKTGGRATRSKSVVRDYVGSKFIDKVRANSVDFVMHSRPFFLAAVDVPGYRDHARMEKITKQIPRADAVWLGRRLGQLSDAQIKDAFRAGGYTPEQVDELAKAVEKRIAELNALGSALP
jgi:hypothetical protein